jgi:lysozyme family protein
MSHFEDAIAVVLNNEGGLRVHPDEPGGAANFGITVVTLRQYRKDPNVGIEDVKNLALDEAKQIYRDLYWDRVHLDKVEGKLSATILMDQAINKGTGGVQQLLVRSLNWRDKSHFNEHTPIDTLITAVNQVPDREFFRRFLADVQLDYVNIAVGNHEKMQYLRGWLIRTHNLMKLLV